MSAATVNVLYLDLNSYFASVEQQVCARLRGRPVAVIPGRTKSSCCIAVSYEAKAFGVKTGTAIREAERLCPGIALRPARHDLYVDYHRRISAQIEQTLPIEAACSIDEFACVLMGEETVLQNAIALALRIKADIRAEIGPAIRCSIGLASNRLLAKIAGDLQKPDGLSWILPGEAHKLHALALDDIPVVGGRMLKRLRAAGVSSVSDLLALEPRHARLIWNSVAGERLLRGCRWRLNIGPPERPG